MPTEWASANFATFSRRNLVALGGASTAGLGASQTVFMAVRAALLSAPFAEVSTECADFLDVATIPGHRADAELAKL